MADNTSSFKDKTTDFFAQYHHAFEIFIEIILILLCYLLKIIIDKNFGTIAILSWAFFMITLISILIFLRSAAHKIQTSYTTRLRICLLNIRTLFVSLAQQIYDASEHNIFHYDNVFCNNSQCNAPNIKSRCFKQRVIKQLKHKVVDMIYQQLSVDNTSLEIIYRVALFEPFSDEHLRVVAFANHEKLRPKSRSLDNGFKKQEGTVGWCWFYGNPLSVPNVPESIDNGNGLFKPMDRHEKSPIGSIVCYPVVNRLRGEEKIEAILCIDSDKIGMFNIRNPKIAKSLRIEIFPYLRFLCLLYSFVNYGLKNHNNGLIYSKNLP